MYQIKETICSNGVCLGSGKEFAVAVVIYVYPVTGAPVL